MSQSALARACKVTPSAINKLIKGDTKTLSGELLLALAAALGVSATWLDTGKGAATPHLQVSIEEHEILVLYRLLNEAHKQTLLSVGRTLLIAQREPISAANPYKKLPVKT